MAKKIIPESELIINPDGSVFHIHLRPEQLTDRIILVGDPARVDMVASFFDTKTFEVSSREFHTIGGTYKGKPIIKNVLTEALRDYPQISCDLAVLSDAAYAAEKCGTHEDFLIASSCLNSTVSGLLSRTFLRSDIIGENDFHGAAFYSELADRDVTYQFIDRIVQDFDLNKDFVIENDAEPFAGLTEAENIREHFGIRSVNFVKPGIGETTRVLLRRIPWKILVYSLNDEENLGHIYQLAREKGVEVVEYPLRFYKSCGLIRDLSDI